MFSIVIPLYNKEKYIERCISCIKKQIFTDFEVIVINDGSTDNSVHLVERLICDDVRFKLYSFNNSGVSKARNRGVKLSKMDFVCFLDADDEWDRYHLQNLFNEIKVTKKLAYCCNYYIKNNEFFQPLVDGFNTGPVTNYYFYCSNDIQLAWTSAVCINRNVLLDVDGFNEEFTLGEDLELWSKVYNLVGFYFIASPSAYYHTDDVESLTKSSRKNTIFALVNNYDEILLNIKEIHDFKKYLINLHFLNFRVSTRSGNKKQAFKILRFIHRRFNVSFIKLIKMLLILMIPSFVWGVLRKIKYIILGLK